MQYRTRLSSIFLFAIVLVLTPLLASAQVGIGTTSPNANAILELDAPDKGFLPPRLDRSTITGLGTGEEGLMLYDNSAGGLYFWDGSSWQELATAAGASVWNTNGAGIDYTSGNVGIGTSAPNSRLEVEAGNIRLDADQSLLSLVGDLSDSPEMIWTGKRQDIIITQTFDITAGMELSGGGTNLDERQLAFRNDNGNLMVSFVENGNVGIGTSTPAATLDVNGNFQLLLGSDVNEITTTVDVASSNDQLPTAAAVYSAIITSAPGDDWGTQLANTTGAIEGDGGGNPIKLVDGTTNGQFLMWDGGGWSTVTTGGDLSGTINSPNVSGIQGRAITTGAPATGDVLKWDGNAWVYAVDDNTTYTGSGSIVVSAGVISNTAPDQTVALTSSNGLVPGGTYPNLEIDLPAGAADDHILQWDAGAGVWESQPSPSGADNWGSQVVVSDATLAGDGAGTPLGIAQQGAATGNVLKWVGGTWQPALDNDTQYSAGAGLSVTPGGVFSNTAPDQTVALTSNNGLVPGGHTRTSRSTCQPAQLTVMS